MALDAGMMRFLLHEINSTLADGKVEKIYEPIAGEVILQIKKDGVKRLLINAGVSAPRICITAERPENPANPPMFCMLLRKHLSGARLISAEPLGFERAAKLTFDVYDEMGFKSTRCIFAEIMGKYSNIILTDGDGKILGASRIVDFSQSVKRQILPGMKYELPPPQDKTDPLESDSSPALRELIFGADKDAPAAKYIMSHVRGISSGNAAQIVYNASGRADALIGDCRDALAGALEDFADTLRSYSGEPILIRNASGVPQDFSFIPQTRYGCDSTSEVCASFGELVDKFYSEKSRSERIRHGGSDILKLLSSAEARILRKRAAQTDELAEANDSTKYKLYGDLLTANIYRLHRGDTSVSLEKYTDGTNDEVNIDLDSRLTPAANAQRYYKKYAKGKTAARVLTKQLEASAAELEYLETVKDALSRAESEREIAEIREELRRAGYGSRTRGGKEKKNAAPTVLKFRTSGGYDIVCGKNNTANEYVTFKLGMRDDWWFHVKNMPGSHVVMHCPVGDEPSEKDFTEAAVIAAVYSKAADSTGVPVDYTRVRYVKKPPASKPGYVTYSKNWTAFVTPDKTTVENLSI